MLGGQSIPVEAGNQQITIMNAQNANMVGPSDFETFLIAILQPCGYNQQNVDCNLHELD